MKANGYFMAFYAIPLLLSSGMISSAANAQNEAITSIYKLEGKCGEVYEIPYSITGGAVRSIAADLDTITVTVQIASANEEEIGADKDGTLIMTFPKAAFFPFGDELVAFVDGEDVIVKILNSTDGFLTFSIDFPDETQEIEIIGSWILSQTPYHRTLNVKAEGKIFPITWDGAPVCSWSFDKEAKKITIHSDNATRFWTTIPHELLGPPYFVTLDGANYQNVDIGTGTGMYIGNFTTISATLRDGKVDKARDIEIIGTTAIPEFSSAAVLAIVGAVIGGSLLFRLRVK